MLNLVSATVGLSFVLAAAMVRADGPPVIGTTAIFPADNIWNVPVDTLPLDARSTTYVQTIGAARYMHADFGSGTWDGGPIGIPYITVPGTQTKVRVTFDYSDESDPGPYPIPSNAPIEGGPSSSGDRHVLVIDRDNHLLYELWSAYPQTDGSWHAGSGAVFDLSSNAMRPAGWTSSDAAGLPVLPGLVRYDEVASGEITHALRFTVPQTRNTYVWPARHYASSLTGTQYPPMGQRFRLKAGYDISTFSSDTQVILRALKKYGMILADNGSAWYVSGAPDERWNNDHLHELGQVPGSAFEAVDVSSLMIDSNSAQAKTSTSTLTTGALAISSTPSGAAVGVDGLPQGTTGVAPLVVGGLSAGSHVLLMTLTNYMDYAQTANVIAGQTNTVAVTMQPVPPPPAPLAISSITPNAAKRGATVRVVITGSGFQAGATVVLTYGTSRIAGSSVVVNSDTTIYCYFKLPANAARAWWNLTVKNLNRQSVTKLSAFRVGDTTRPVP